MRGTVRIAAGFALVVCGCAGDTASDVIRDQGAGTAGGGAQAGSGAGVAGSGDGMFGNSNGAAPNQPNTPGTDPNMTGGSGGSCVAGQFCAPTSPDPDDCGTLAFEPDVEITRTPGNLLVIFDQSLSMEDPWPSTGSTKILAARMALEAALAPLQTDLTVGALFLPQRGCAIPFVDVAWQGNAVDPIDSATQIAFQAGPQFLTAWGAHWGSYVPGVLGTPLQEGFDKANVAIDAAIQNMTLTGLIAVVAFTDGEPNCMPDPAMYPSTPADQHAANWLSMGIKTYVVGLPGANGAATLTAVAQSGGTMNYIDPSNPADLEMRLRDIVSETVTSGFNSCSMSLNPMPDLPDELLMIVEEPGVGEQQVPRDRGWSLTVDNGTAMVEITGGLCDAAMAGRFNTITFKYACPASPPPPALPPVE